MTQYHRGVGRIPVFADVYIGATDARSDDAHQNFVVSRTLHLKGFDVQGAAFLAENGRLNLVHLHVGMVSQCSIPFLHHIRWLLEEHTFVRAVTELYSSYSTTVRAYLR